MSTPYLYPLYCACCNNRIDPNSDHDHDDNGDDVCSVECMQVNNDAITPDETPSRGDK